jgi:nucleotide sugar dehydrogenase
MAKVLENTYRAMNIAFIREWTQYAQNAGVNLYEVIDAIRCRSTHKNIMAPGLGVGGYCLPKDPLLADWSYRELFGHSDHLSMSLHAVSVNDMMPDYSFGLLKDMCPDLSGRHVALLGVSYRPDVGDTRYTPSALFYDRCIQEGAEVTAFDEYVTYWPEKEITVQSLCKESYGGIDVVVCAQPQKCYRHLTACDLMTLFPDLCCVLDTNDVLSDESALALTSSGITISGTGKGHWKEMSRV